MGLVKTEEMIDQSSRFDAGDGLNGTHACDCPKPSDQNWVDATPNRKPSNES